MAVPENAIPAGSQPIDQPPAQETIPGQATKQAIDQAAKEGLILGKFKTPDEVVPAYQALEQDHGRLGQEVGTLRKQNEMLLNLANNATKGGTAATAQPEPGPDFDKLMAETRNAIKEGDLSIDDGLQKIAEITALQTAAIAKQTYAQMDSERTAKDFIGQFQKDHPDYAQALQSGELDAIKARNPMHDNLSAYYEWSANKAKADAEQAVKDAFEKGRNETASLAAGADATKRVLGKAGSETRMTNTNSTYTPITEAGKISGMLDALKAARTPG
jgi:hypothetical protein